MTLALIVAQATAAAHHAVLFHFLKAVADERQKGVESGLKGISLRALTPQPCDMREFGSSSFVVNRHQRCTTAI